MGTSEKNLRLIRHMLPYMGALFWLPSPVIFQRIQMAKNVYQARKSFLYATAISLLVSGLLVWIALLAKVKNVTPLNQQALIYYILNEYATPGFKGVLAMGVMSMVLSTADSFLNSSAVLLVHDIASPLGLKKENKMFAVRLEAVLIGSLSIFMALTGFGIYQVIGFGWTILVSVVFIPIVLSFFGFRTSQRAVLIGMGVGFL